MIATIIFLLIFILSVAGIVFIVRKKMPILVQMPHIHEGIQRKSIMESVKESAGNILPNEIHFVKWLSKIRVWVLKLEKYIDIWLQKTRKLIVQNNRHAKRNGKNKKTSSNGVPPAPPV